MLNPYLPENIKLGWSTSGAQPEIEAGGFETAVSNPGDPLFAGVTLTNGYADLVSSNTTAKAQPASAYEVSGMQVLGETTNDATAVIARILEGAAWSSSVGADGIQGGHRIVFWYSNPVVDETYDGLYTDLTADGQVVLGNAIAELLDPPALWLFFNPETIDGGGADVGYAYSGSLTNNLFYTGSGPMTFSLVDDYTWLTVGADGSLSGIPLISNVGTNEFDVQVSTPDAGTVSATLIIEVVINEAPAFTTDPIVFNSTIAGEAYTNSIAGYAEDAEGDPLEFSKVDGPAWLSVSTNGLVTGTPGSSDLGLNEFTVQVEAIGGSDTAALTINVLDGAAMDIYEAEDAFYTNATVGSTAIGFTGSGYVDYKGDTLDCYVEWTVVVPAAADYGLVFRYAVANSERPLDIWVNGVLAEALKEFPVTGAWDNYERTVPMTVALDAGTNTVRAISEAGSGFTGGNMDHLAIYLKGSPATIEGVTFLANGTAKMAIGGAVPASDYHVESTTDLILIPWAPVAHSDDGVNEYRLDNLTYSSTDGTNKFIYLQTTNSAEFFRIQGAE
jgi:hypothetical protein